MTYLRRTKPGIKYLKETSDESGFDNMDGKTLSKRWTSLKGTSISQSSLDIAPDEYDVPPLSDESLGGADISGVPRSNSDTTTIPIGYDITIQLITASGGINASNTSIIYVTGSASAVQITANPQISRGSAQQIMTVQCVDSSVTLSNGTGLSLINSQPFKMGSGSIITFYYSGTDNLWHEISRVQDGRI